MGILILKYSVYFIILFPLLFCSSSFSASRGMWYKHHCFSELLLGVGITPTSLSQPFTRCASMYPFILLSAQVPVSLLTQLHVSSAVNGSLKAFKDMEGKLGWRMKNVQKTTFVFYCFFTLLLCLNHVMVPVELNRTNL